MSFKLQQGDRLILFTDGLIEGVNSKGQQFGERRFIRNMLEDSTSSSQTTLDLQRVLKSFDDFRGEESLNDDVTLVFCDFKGDAIAS
jgi:sigma-B regulation protein RsbU (phosphoserine phosphatase)